MILEEEDGGCAYGTSGCQAQMLADRLGRRSLQELRGTQEPTGKTGLWGVGGFWCGGGVSPLKPQQGCRTPKGAAFGEPGGLAGKLR
jgi:hypothetical protein